MEACVHILFVFMMGLQNLCLEAWVGWFQRRVGAHPVVEAQQSKDGYSLERRQELLNRTCNMPRSWTVTMWWKIFSFYYETRKCLKLQIMLSLGYQDDDVAHCDHNYWQKAGQGNGEIIFYPSIEI